MRRALKLSSSYALGLTVGRLEYAYPSIGCIRGLMTTVTWVERLDPDRFPLIALAWPQARRRRQPTSLRASNASACATLPA